MSPSDTRTTTPARPGLRRLVAVAALAGTMLISICGAPRAALAADPVPPPCGPLTSAPPIALPAPAGPAAVVLRQLAGRITAVPSDAQAGRYTRIGLAMSGADSEIGECVRTVTATATEVRWRDEITDSGQIIGTPWYSDSATPPVQIRTYRRGELPGTLTGRAPADPARLAAALDAVYPDDDTTLRAARTLMVRAGARRAAGGANRVRAVGDLVRWHGTPLAVRRAILRVLADVPGLRTHGTITVAGRRGLAVSLPDGASQHVLLINPASGEIDAVEEVLTDPRIAANLAVTAPFSFSRTVVGGRGRTDTWRPGAHWQTSPRRCGPRVG